MFTLIQSCHEYVCPLFPIPIPYVPALCSVRVPRRCVLWPVVLGTERVHPCTSLISYVVATIALCVHVTYIKPRSAELESGPVLSQPNDAISCLHDLIDTASVLGVVDAVEAQTTIAAFGMTQVGKYWIGGSFSLHVIELKSQTY
jgi:hypothetical protein